MQATYKENEGKPAGYCVCFEFERDGTKIGLIVDTLAALLGIEDGTYDLSGEYVIGAGFPEAAPSAVYSCDFDGDGNNDMAVGNSGRDTDGDCVPLGNGDGALAGAVSYGVGDDPTSFYSCDLDGDGDNDLAVVNSHSNNVAVLLNIVNMY